MAILTESEKNQLDQHGFSAARKVLYLQIQRRGFGSTLYHWLQQSKKTAKVIHTLRMTVRNASGISLIKARYLKRLFNNRKCSPRWSIYSVLIAR